MPTHYTPKYVEDLELAESALRQIAERTEEMLARGYEKDGLFVISKDDADEVYGLLVKEIPWARDDF